MRRPAATVSGLFRRLARQASGRATTLHAPAKLPFHDAPAVAGVAPGARATMPDEAPSRVVVTAVRPPAAAAHGLGTTRPAEVGQPGASVLPADGAARESRLSPVRKENEDPSGFDPAAGDDLHDTPAEAAAAARDLRPLRPPRAQISAYEAPGSKAPNVPRDQAAALPRSRRSADSAAAPGDAIGAARAAEATAMEAFPERLLPPAAGPAPAGEATSAGSKPPARRDGPASSSATDMPNEVHVHIGRVEVTALQESAPKPRTIRNGRAPMSLDEYLAKRQRQAP